MPGVEGARRDQCDAGSLAGLGQRPDIRHSCAPIPPAMTRLAFMASAACALTGAACLAIAAGSPAYVDDQRFLVEPFAWIATGRLLLLAALAGGAITSLAYFLRRDS